MNAMHSSSSCSTRGAAPLMTKKQQWRRMHSSASSSLPFISSPAAATVLFQWNYFVRGRKSGGAPPPATPPLSPFPALPPTPPSPPHLESSRSSNRSAPSGGAKVRAITPTEGHRPMRRVASMDTLSSGKTSTATHSSSARRVPCGVDSADASDDPEAEAGGNGAGAGCDRQEGGGSPRPSSSIIGPTGETTRPAEASSTSAEEETAPRRKTAKKVRFNRCVRMVLVPSRRDIDAVTASRIWWGREELAEFRHAAAKLFLKQKARETAMAAAKKSASKSTLGSFPSGQEKEGEELLRRDRAESRRGPDRRDTFTADLPSDKLAAPALAPGPVAAAAVTSATGIAAL